MRISTFTRLVEDKIIAAAKASVPHVHKAVEKTGYAYGYASARVACKTASALRAAAAKLEG